MTYKRLKDNDKEDIPPLLPNPWNILLSSEIQDKKRHYWIWSQQPNAGKTTKFLKPLELTYKASFYNTNELY